MKYSDTITKDNEDIHYVHYSKLQLPQGYEASEQDYIRINELKESIAKVGIVKPLSVFGPNAEDLYTILSGRKRYLAVLELIKTTDFPKEIPVMVRDNLNDLELQLTTVTSDLETCEKSQQNQLRFSIISILKEFEMSGEIKRRNISQIAAKHMRVSKRFSRMYLQIFERGSSKLKKLVSDNEITVASASRICEFEPAVQDKIVEEYQRSPNINAILSKYLPLSSSETAKTVLPKNRLAKCPSQETLNAVKEWMIYLKNTDAPTEKDLELLRLAKEFFEYLE